MKYNEILDIDEDDKKILELLQKNCEITHKEIAKKIGKSQPAVGARILKMERRNLLLKQMGINFKEAELKYVRIHISTKNTAAVWHKFKNCPVILNVFKITGRFNMAIELVAPSVKTIERFIDDCLRSDDRIMNIQTTYLIDSLFPAPVQIKFALEDFQNKGCNRVCQSGIDEKDLKTLIEEE